VLSVLPGDRHVISYERRCETPTDEA